MTSTAPAVTLRLPTVLKLVVGKDLLRVRGRTIPEALESAFDELPNLRRHLLLPSGELRPHILCLRNGESILRAEIADTALADGDELWIHQAISGG